MVEEFLINFDNTVIVVSHDRYFLNKVCTQIADIDYAKIQLYAGNYDFWYESSQLIVKQMKEANRKKEEKIKELQDFIQRFSANASKSKQATSRKRALEKIELDEIRPSSRKYPYIDFRPNREIGNEVLTVEHLSKTIDGVKVLDDISFVVGREDKIAFVGSNGLAKTTLFQILAGRWNRMKVHTNGELQLHSHTSLRITLRTLTVMMQLLTGLHSTQTTKTQLMFASSLAECYSPVMQVLRKFAYFPVVKKLELCFQNL